VRLGGRELRDYRADQVRDMLAAADQNAHLFNATVRENLLLARPAAAAEELAQAAACAGADDFIQSLPEGWSTPIG